jgi:DNA-binding NarL/FixJ family response regulator
MDLTDRELKILREMAEGYPYNIIAQRLFLGRTTVNREAGSILKKLRAVNAQNAIHRAYQLGVLKRESADGN